MRKFKALEIQENNNKASSEAQWRPCICKIDYIIKKKKSPSTANKDRKRLYHFANTARPGIAGFGAVAPIIIVEDLLLLKPYQPHCQ